MAKNSLPQLTINDAVVIIALLVAYPIGVILMFFLVKWNGFIKTLVIIPFVILLIAAFSLMTQSLDKKAVIDDLPANYCSEQCRKTSGDQKDCMNQCIQKRIDTLSN